MAQASDIFSHLRQNHGDLRQNHGDLRQNYDNLRQNQETCTRIMVAGAKTMETCTRIMDTCTGIMETCAALLATSAVPFPYQHRHSATPAPSLRRASTVTLPHSFRHISSCEAWRDSIRYCHRGKEPYLGFCRFVH